MVTVEVRGESYYMADGLKEKWDEIKDGKLTTYDEDRFYICDGHEGTGKSLFIMQQAAYIDPTILDDENGRVLPRICFTVDEFLRAVRTTRSTENHTKCIIFDEAFRGMSSKSALSGINKQVVEALMEARQNNLVVFIISPSFYMLEFYPAVLRSKALFHVKKEKKSRRRYVRIFNYRKKAELYQIGVRKGWGYPVLTRIKVRFYNKYPGGSQFEARYRKKKRDSLVEAPKKKEIESKYKAGFEICVLMNYKQTKSFRKTAKELTEAGFSISDKTVGSIINKFKEKGVQNIDFEHSSLDSDGEDTVEDGNELEN